MWGFALLKVGPRWPKSLSWYSIMFPNFHWSNNVQPFIVFIIKTASSYINIISMIEILSSRGNKYLHLSSFTTISKLTVKRKGEFPLAASFVDIKRLWWFFPFEHTFSLMVLFMFLFYWHTHSKTTKEKWIFLLEIWECKIKEEKTL